MSVSYYGAGPAFFPGTRHGHFIWLYYISYYIIISCTVYINTAYNAHLSLSWISISLMQIKLCQRKTHNFWSRQELLVQSQEWSEMPFFTNTLPDPSGLKVLRWISRCYCPSAVLTFPTFPQERRFAVCAARDLCRRGRQCHRDGRSKASGQGTRGTGIREWYDMASSLKNPFLCYCQIGNNLVNRVCFEFWLVRLVGNESSWIFVGISWSMFELRNPPSPGQSHYAAKPDMNCTDTPNMTQFRYFFLLISCACTLRLNNKIVRNGVSTFDAPSHQIFVSLQVQSKDDTRRLSSQHIL